MNMKILVVDDEPAAITTLKDYIKATPGLEYIAGCINSYAAKEVFNINEDIDVVILDYEMEGEDGETLAKFIGDRAMIIFSTGHADFAVKSYEYGAIDFLLKPYSYDRFLKAIEKCAQYKGRTAEQWLVGKEEITINDSRKGKLIIIEKTAISYISAFGNYSKIMLNNGELLMPLKSLVAVFDMLHSNLFLRVHRSYVINIKAVKAFDKDYVTLKDGTEIKLGRVHKSAFKKWIHKHGLS